MTRRCFALLAAAAAVILIAGCGGASTDAGTRTEATAGLRADRGMVQFARCMREHGVGMADPFHRPGHQGLSIDLPQPGPATTSAYNACGRFLQATIELKQRAAAQRVTPTMRLGLIRYAECMRSHAIPMLDPNAFGQLALGNVPGTNDSIGRYTRQFHSADHSCRHLLPVTIADNGTGP